MATTAAFAELPGEEIGRGAAILVAMARADPRVQSGRGGGESPIGEESLATTVRVAGLSAGLAAVETIAAQVLQPAHSVLAQRKAAGLNGPMQFTYRNPDRSADPWATLPSAQSMYVGIYPYAEAVGSEPVADASPTTGSYHRATQQPATDGAARAQPDLMGRKARYAADGVYQRLGHALDAMATVLRAKGHKAVVVADSNALVDRNAAWLAGLGWYGKNTNLLNRQLGSWFVIGAVITNAPLEGGSLSDGNQPSAAPMDDGCGSCNLCIEACPTDALVAPGVLDPTACIAWMVQAAEPIPLRHRPAIGDRIYGCDICQDVCPPNKVVVSRRGAGSTSGMSSSDPDLVSLSWVLEASDEDLLHQLGRWYIANRDPNVIRRTALVVAGNSGDGNRPLALQLVSAYLDHPDPLLAEHARWAARQLGEEVS